MNKKLILQKLTDKDDKAAYEYAKKINIESAKSDKYLCMISMFADMLQDKSSFVRARFFILICAQARWANEGQIESVFDQMKVLLNDPKPTVVRQCLNAMHELVLYRPGMSDAVKEALLNIDISQYKDSMSSLIKKDIDELIKIVN